jgi:hypothetical protein
VSQVFSCNSTLNDIARVLGTNLTRTFPHEGRTAVTSPLLHLQGNIVLPMPSVTYTRHNESNMLWFNFQRHAGYVASLLRPLREP